MLAPPIVLVCNADVTRMQRGLRSFRPFYSHLKRISKFGDRQHLHFAGRCEEPHRMSDFLWDFKKHTSKTLANAVLRIPESRREWLMDKFVFGARRSSRADRYKIWRDDNHAIDLSGLDIRKKLSYMHDNPVRAGIVERAEVYLMSSA